MKSSLGITELRSHTGTVGAGVSDVSSSQLHFNTGTKMLLDQSVNGAA